MKYHPRLIQGFALATVIALSAGCASKPKKKSEHELANILLGKPPAMGVTEGSTEESAGETQQNRDESIKQLAPKMTDQMISSDRENDKRRDQEAHDAKMAGFRARFEQLISREKSVSSSLSPADQANELEKIAYQMEELHAEVARYRESPGTLYFYKEGEERTMVLEGRNADLLRLEQEWSPEIEGLQEKISTARSVHAMKRLQETISSSEEPAPTPKPQDEGRDSSEPGVFGGASGRSLR